MSLMRRFEARVPLAVGLKVTLTVQLAPGARPAPPIGQLLVCAKLLAFPPPIEILVITSAEPPELVMVTLCGALVVPTVCAGNVSDVGDRVIAAPATPVPLNVTVRFGFRGSLLLMTKLAERAPTAVGLNRTLMLQLAPAAKVAPQLVVLEKSPALTPVIVMLLIVNVALPRLNSVVV